MIVAGTASAAATSVAIPAHQPGDMIIVSARGTAAVPTAPAAGGTVPTWTNIQGAIANALGLRSSYCIATASNHTSGVWTNATHLCVTVLRADAGGSLALGGGVAGAGNNTQTIIYPALTLQKTDGTSWGVRVGTRVVAVTAVANPPTNWTNQIVQPAGASALMSVHTRAGLAANPVADTVTTTSSNSAYRAQTIEVIENPPPPAFPTNALVDDFNRADQYPAGSRWLGSFRANGLQVLANQLTNPAALWDGMYWNSPAVADPDVRVAVATVGATGQIFQFQLRCDFAADTAYVFSFFPGGVEVYRRIASADVLIASNYAVPTAVGDTIGASVIGTTVTAWRQPAGGAYAAVATVTNSEISAAGVVAIYSNGGWIVDDLYSGTPPAPPLTLDLADTVTPSDSFTPAQDFGLSLADTAASGDSLGTAADYVLNPADTVALADTSVQDIVIEQALADTVPVADVASVQSDIALDFADSLVLDDVASLQISFSIDLSLSDTLPVDDTASPVADYSLDFADSETLAEGIIEIAIAEWCPADAVCGTHLCGEAICGTWFSCPTAGGLQLGGTPPDLFVEDEAVPSAGLILGTNPPGIVMEGLVDPPEAGLILGSRVPDAAIIIPPVVVSPGQGGLHLGAAVPELVQSAILQPAAAGLGLGTTVPDRAEQDWLTTRPCVDIALPPAPEAVVVLVGVVSSNLVLAADPEQELVLVGSAISTIVLDPQECR